MILITGGAFQGKTEYTRNNIGNDSVDYIEGGSCELEEIFEKPMIVKFHLYIRRVLEEDKDIGSFVEELIRRNPEIIIVVDELGCGVVPMEPFDRLYRETVGRVCCQIAKEAKEVHRVFCGIGTVIKK